MPKTLEQLTAQRNDAWKKIEELRSRLPETGVWSAPEDRAAWDAANKDYDEATAEIDALKDGEDVRRRMAELEERRRRDAEARGGDREDPNHPPRGDLPPESGAELFRAWARCQAGLPLTDAQQRLCQRAQFLPQQRAIEIPLGPSIYARQLQDDYRSVHPSQRHTLQQRALTVSATSGGDMIARGIMPRFERAMLDYSGVLQAATIMRTATGEPLDMPTANDTGNEGALLAINTQAASNVDPATAEVTLAAYKFTSKIVLVPTELIEDDSAGFIDALPDMLGERIGRVVETYCTTGSGSSQPNGIVTASAAGVTAASATAVTAAELIGLEHSVDPAYRQNAGFMMHDNVIKALRLLVDGEGRFLWASGLRDGRPDTLLGYRVFRNQKMASTLEASAKIILFGDFSKYVVRMVRSVRFYRMVERYRDYDQDGFVCFLRMDGNLLNAGVAPVKRITLAAS